MGVCSHKTLSQVYFVDTYNNRVREGLQIKLNLVLINAVCIIYQVKVVDVDSQSCFTLCGNGAPGNVVGDLSDVKVHCSFTAYL